MYIKGSLLGLISIVISAIIYVFLVFLMKMIKKKEMLQSIENSGFAKMQNGKCLKNKKKIEKI